MKLLALLAALLLFVGMRQILAWQWAGSLALALIPLLPIAITAMFYWFGIRSLGAGAYGGYVYCVVAVVLAGFSVFAANEFWLGGAIAQRMAFCLAAAASAALAGATLRRTGETVFLHLAAAGAAMALAAAIPAQGSGGWLEPGPVVMFGGSQTLLALAYAGAARRLMRSSLDSALSRQQARALLVWAHVCAAAAAGRAVLGLAAGEDVAQTAAVFAAGATLYATVAHWHRSTGAAWLSAALMAAAALLALQASAALSWHSAGLAAVVLNLAAGGLTRHAMGNRVTAEGKALAASWSRIRHALGGVSGAALLASIAWSVAGIAPPVDTGGWPWIVLLAAAVSTLHARTALELGRFGLLYVAATEAAVGLAVLAHALVPGWAALHPHSLAVDLILPAAVLVGAGLLLRWTSGPGPSAGLAQAAHPLLDTAASTVSLGLAATLWQGLRFGPAPTLWMCICSYGLIATVGTAALRHQGGRVLSPWAGCAFVAVDLGAGFLAAGVAGGPWTPGLAAGTALVLSAWLWRLLADRVARRAPGAEGALHAGVAATALTGATLASSGADQAAWWMVAAFAGALALLVWDGTARGRMGPVLASLWVVVLCPLRLAGAALEQDAESATAALAATQFALGSAAFYGWAAWRSARPGLAWLGVASLAVALGGGALFGAAQPALPRLIAQASGFGVAGGAVGLAVLARRSRRPLLTYASGVLLIAAYLRLATLYLLVDRVWLGAALLPALIILVAASHLRDTGDGTVLHRPLQRVAVTAAYIALPWVAAVAIGQGTAGSLPMAVTLFSYALVFGASAQAGREIDHPLGALSTAALIGGWVFGLQVPRAHPSAHLADALLVAVTAGCSLLYGRIALRLRHQAPAYGAALAACCAWMGLTGRVLALPERSWSLTALPFLVGLYALGLHCGAGNRGVLGPPLRHAALAAAGAAILWQAAWAIALGTPAAAGIAAATLAAYAGALALGAVWHRTVRWAAGAASMLTVSWGFLAASHCQNSADWALRVVGAAAAWLAAALLVRRTGRAEVARALGRLAGVSAALAAAAAVPSVGDIRHAMLSMLVFTVAGAVEAGLLRVMNNRAHAHGAFAALAVAYMVALRHGLGLGAAFADFYLLPVAVYLLILGHLLARRHRLAGAAAVRWLGLGAALVPAMAAFLSGGAGARTVHGLLLVVECVAAIGCGLAGRVRACVQAGTAGALLYVVVSALAVTEIWAGFFSAALGIALLALIFYLSVHAGEVRSRLERFSGGWRH